MHPSSVAHEDESSVSAVAYSPDGKYLASGSCFDTVRQWDASAGEPFGKWLYGSTSSTFSSVAYSPLGTFLAAGSSDKIIYRWVASTGEHLDPLIKGHTEAVMSVAYSPDDRYLASGSSDKTVRQWDSSTGQAFGSVMQGHTASVKSVAYSPDGRHLASAGADYRICVWNLRSEGDFSLIWCTRSGADPLIALGLRLNNAFGLETNQSVLLASAGCEEARKVKPMVSTNDSSFFAQSTSRPGVAINGQEISGQDEGQQIPEEIRRKSLTKSQEHPFKDLGKIHTIDGDGNCFFRAVAHELERQSLGTYTHQELRRLAIQYLRHHIDMFQENPLEHEEDVKSYLERMARDQEYAEQHILDALAKTLNIQLTIIRIQETAEHQQEVHPISINESADNRGVIGLMYQGDNLLAHYDAFEFEETSTYGHRM